MYKRVVLIITVASLAYLSISWRQDMAGNIAFGSVRNTVLHDLLQLKDTLSAIINSPNLTSRKAAYNGARRLYKKNEFFIEYCSPREAKYFINGALVPKHDEEHGRKVIYPNGFQQIEEHLFTEDGITDTSVLNSEVRDLIAQFNHLYQYYLNIELRDAQLLEMCQLELFRIASMNLNGYDATITLSSIKETSFCLQGLSGCISYFSSYRKQFPDAEKIENRLQQKLLKAENYLKRHPDYNTFDRLHFITEFINPINASIVEFHNCLQLPWSGNKQAIFLNRKTLFARENFNTRFFSIYYDDTLNINYQAMLGKTLFSDPILSGTGRFACATCHNPELAFTDTLLKSRSIHDHETLNRNTPTLWNVVFQKAFFADGRAYQLEQQVFDVVHNKNEMDGSLPEIVKKLKKDAKYRLLFSRAFAGTADTGITEYSIKKAITEYENTLIALNSRFDDYITGKGKLSNREIKGYNLFAGKALCGSCHFFPLFNGTVPPFFTDTEFEIIGTPEMSMKGQKKEDEDLGRLNVTDIPEHKNAFKTPGLRKIISTYPYMHNGVYRTLEEVVDFYQKGGGRGLKLNYPNQTLPFDSLQLSKRDKEDIILFLKTL